MSQTQLAGDLREGTFKYCTPLGWIQPIAEAVGGFDLDPCACDDSHLAETNIRNVGGLRTDWGEYGKVYANHPFDKPTPWIRKAATCDADLVITLSKADPSADWFQDWLIQADYLCFPNRRIEFVGFDNDPGFGIVFGAFGDVPDSLVQQFESLGWTIALDADK